MGQGDDLVAARTRACLPGGGHVIQTRRLFAGCAAVAILALLIIGAVSDGIVRHIIQTLPFWIVIVLGLRGARLTKWLALPMFLIWLLIMVLIWLYLLGLTEIISGRFSATEIAMTIVVGATALANLVYFRRDATGVRWPAAALALIAAAMLQVGAIALSLQATFASDTAFRQRL